MERLSKSAFKLRSGNKPSPMELSGVSPMKDGVAARMSDPPQYPKHYHNEKGNPVATGGFTTNEGAQHVSNPNKPEGPKKSRNEAIEEYLRKKSPKTLKSPMRDNGDDEKKQQKINEISAAIDKVKADMAAGKINKVAGMGTLKKLVNQLMKLTGGKAPN